MADSDVAEYIRAVFAPLIRAWTIQDTKRERTETVVRVSEWKPYQASSTPERPCLAVAWLGSASGFLANAQAGAGAPPELFR
jgi:hypothetical protein